jgi:SAM-dependent methyltransferase
LFKGKVDEMSPAAAGELVEQILASSGVGSVLVLGRDVEQVTRGLNARGVPAQGADVAEVPRMRVRTIAVLGLEDVGAELLTPLFDRWRRAATALFLRVDTSNGVTRTWWEERLFEAGFRKRPSYYDHAPYEALESETGVITIVCEPVPEEALAQYPLVWLLEERALHMDMMRETGRRSDAHVHRYAVAAQHVRAGDVVLDIACGYGYGSHLILHHSAAAKVIGLDSSTRSVTYADRNYALPGRAEFRVGDAENLDLLPDHSVDMVISFETLEHLRRPNRLIDEVFRVLRPGGRFIASVQNQWLDQSGRDPNPHHLHIYCWSRLQSEVGRKFLLEQAWAQVAGGGLKLTDRPRTLTPFPPDGGLPCEAEWLLLIAMKDPPSGKDVPYVETMYAPADDPAGNVTAFARDYGNPWLVRSLISIGSRIASSARRTEVANVVMTTADPSSADYGAALCVRAYTLLDGPTEDSNAVTDVITRIDKYLSVAADNPHVLRWQVSNSYVQGLLHSAAGHIDQATRAWERCVAFDAARFSPLLLTKTIDARLRLATHAVSMQRTHVARQHLEAAIASIEHGFSQGFGNIIGSMTRPNTFGFMEAANVMMLGQRAALALNYLDLKGELPGLAHQRMVDADSRSVAARLYNVIADYEKTKHEWFKPELKRLTRELATAQIARKDLARDHARICEELKETQRRQSEYFEPELERITLAVTQCKAVQTQLRRDLQEKHAQLLYYADENGVLASRVSPLRARVEELERVKRDWFEPRIRELESQVARRSNWKNSRVYRAHRRFLGFFEDRLRPIRRALKKR